MGDYWLSVFVVQSRAFAASERLTGNLREQSMHAPYSPIHDVSDVASLGLP